MRTLRTGLRFVLGMAVICLFIAPVFMHNQFGQMDFEQILFVLVSQGDGANVDIVLDYLIFVVPYLIAYIAFLYVYRIVRAYDYSLDIKIGKRSFARTVSFERTIKKTMMLYALTTVMLVTFINNKLDVSGYVSERLNPGTLYETYYVDPNDVALTFPEEKQNLIYIVLESMNTNFSSVDVDNETVNLIPELEALAASNISFSNNDAFGGFLQARGVSWTAGSLVGQTSGVPLQIPIGGNSYGKDGVFLPGITTLGEILEENGYSNYYLMGSDGDFGGRQTYFETHGNYQVLDTKYLKEIGYIPDDYHVFWGMEDAKLIDFAKEKLTEIAAQEAPFNFSMLTVDSHFMDGYTDASCASDYSVAYANAVSCSASMISEFISWIQEQSFYENTTVIVVGDHNTMNNEFLVRATDDDYSVYNAFLNVNVPEDGIETRMRTFTVMDLFPTTLASLGVVIEGNKLGLGTNLFSGEKTLPELIGFDLFNEELAKKSLYYEKNFFK